MLLEGLTSFVLLDLGQMVSELGAKARGLAKGSTWLHPITMANLQQLCGMVSIACASLEEGQAWCPWRSTELTLEVYFGALRGQFPSSQMSMRDYLQAAARKMRHTSLKLQREPAELLPVQPESPLSSEQFAACAQRALDAALRLMSIASNQTVQALLKTYVSFAADRMQEVTVDELQAGSEDMDGEECQPDGDEEEVPLIRKHDPSDADPVSPALTGSDAECYQLLSQLQARETADRLDFETGELPSMDDREMQRLGVGKQSPPALDEATWKQLTSADADAKPLSEPACKDARSDTILTLSTALEQARAGPQVPVSMDPVLPWLWLLLANLRSAGDSHILPNPTRLRQANANLNWRQISERELAMVRAQCGAPSKRTSRAAAWRAVAASLKQRCESDAEQPAELASGMIVLLVPPGYQQWTVGVVLTVWRVTPRGAKLTHLATPVAAVKYIRVTSVSALWSPESLTRMARLTRVTPIEPGPSAPCIEWH